MVVGRCAAAEPSLEGFGAGARAFRGCWRMEIKSSTRRADAIGAAPGRVTVHCWSRVASFRDFDQEKSVILFDVGDLKKRLGGTYVCWCYYVVAEVASDFDFSSIWIAGLETVSHDHVCIES